MKPKKERGRKGRLEKAEGTLANIESLIREIDFGWDSHIDFWNNLARIIEDYKDYPRKSIKRKKEL